MSTDNEDSLPTQWSRLLHNYHHSISFTSECGARGQHYIDNAHNDLIVFCNTHPEYKDKIPKRAQCDDDGGFGIPSGMTTMAHSVNRDDVCSINRDDVCSIC